MLSVKQALILSSTGSLNLFYPSYFKLLVHWLRSFARITYLSKRIGTFSLAALLGLRPRPFGASANAVLSCNSNYFGYTLFAKGVFEPLDVVSGESYHIETAIYSLKAPILSAEPQMRGFE